MWGWRRRVGGCGGSYPHVGSNALRARSICVPPDRANEGQTRISESEPTKCRLLDGVAQQ